MAFFQTTNLWIQELADSVAALVLDGPDDHNALRLDSIVDLEQALDKLESEPRFKLLMIRSGKPYHFCVGFNPQEARSLSTTQWSELSRRGQSLCVRISKSRLVSVAVIGGQCLGAGLELALACDYRVVVEKATTVLAFPQVEVGLVPCWGGTVRLPRKIGLEKAQQMILTGKKINAHQALAWGVADVIVAEDNNEPPEFLEHPRKQPPEKIARRGWRQWIFESLGLGRRFLRRGTERILRRKLPESFAAPWEAVDLVFRSMDESSLDFALKREHDAHVRLVAEPAFRNLVDFQARRERIRQSATPHPNLPKMVGIVGLSTRGLGILLQLVAKGCHAVVHEQHETSLGLGLFRIFQMFQEEVNRGAMSASQLQKNLSAIRGTISWKNFDEAEVVFDTREDTWQDDPEFIQELEYHSAPDAILVSNGLTVDAAALDHSMGRTGRQAWTYWHEPLSRHSLVELVESPRTDEKLRIRLAEFLRFLGKTVVKCPETPGLMVHRILVPMFNEAGILLKQGVSPESVDEAMRAFGMDAGPFARIARMGLADVVSLLEACQPRFQGRIQFESGFRAMWQDGWSGRKTRGLFEHARHRRNPDVGLLELWRTKSEGTNVASLPAMSHRDRSALIQDRLVYLVVAEAIRWMLEFPQTEASTLDFAMESIGWPVHRGGPIQFARDLGAEALAAKIESLREEHGARYLLPQGWESTLMAGNQA